MTTKPPRAGIRAAKPGLFRFTVQCPHCATPHLVECAVQSYLSRPSYDWASVDWSQTNVAIAVNLGCGVVQVSKRRLRHAPETADKSRQKLIDWASVDWSQKNTHLARIFGRTQGAVSMARRKYAPQTLRSRKQP